MGPLFNTVQTHGGHPLERAHSKVVKELLKGEKNPSERQRQQAITQAKGSKADYMQAWEEPHSVAHGILDDETYDWMNLCDAMLQTRGEALVVSDERVCQATDVARHLTGV